MISSINTFNLGFNNKIYSNTKPLNANLEINNSYSTTNNNSTINSSTTTQTSRNRPLRFIACASTGDFISIRKPDDFDPENPAFIVRGKDFGKEFEKLVNVNDIDPTNASFIEMAVLQQNLREKGIIQDTIMLFPHVVDEDGAHSHRISFFAKKNFVEKLSNLYNRVAPQQSIVCSTYVLAVRNLLSAIS